MSLLELRSGLKVTVLLAGLSIGLAGCTFRPMYADVTPEGAVIGGDNHGIGGQLPRIDIPVLGEREGIELRNKLIFVLGGSGREAQSPAYRLNITLSKNDTPLAIQAVSGRPTASTVQITANYTLVEIATGKQLFKSTAIARASYDKTVQRFANIRAEIDAENRAIDELSQFIRNGLAGYFAHPTS